MFVRGVAPHRLRTTDLNPGLRPDSCAFPLRPIAYQEPTKTPLTTTNAPVVFLSFLFPLPFFLAPCPLAFYFYWRVLVSAHWVGTHYNSVHVVFSGRHVGVGSLFPLRCSWECNPWAAAALPTEPSCRPPSDYFHHASLQEQIPRSWLGSTSCESPSSPFPRTSPPHSCPISGQDK